MDAGPFKRFLSGARRHLMSAWCATGSLLTFALLVLPGQAASASPVRGEIDLPNGMQIATSQARGLACSYQAPAENTDSRLAWLPSTSPALAVPPTGDSVYLVTRATASTGPALIRADARTVKATIIGTPISPGSATSARVCQVITDHDGSTAAVLLIAPDGTVQWSVLRPGREVVPIIPPTPWILTPAATFTADGTRLAVIAKPCDTCTDPYLVLAYDTALGTEVGRFTVPIDSSVLASQPDALSVGPSRSGFVVAARTQQMLALWSMSDTMLTVARRDLVTTAGQAAATTPSCRAQPGIQVNDNAFITAARISIDSGPLSGLDPDQLPTGESVRLIDVTTLQDRVTFDAYRRPKPAYIASQTLCPYFGPGGDVVDAEIVYSAHTGNSLGWLSNGEYLAGRFQNGDRFWQVPDWLRSPTYVSFEPWKDSWLWASEIPQNFAPTVTAASAAQIQASPALAHLIATLREFPKGDFTMYSFTDTGDDFLTTINLDRRGETYRYIEPYYVDAPRKIIYANSRLWCTRKTTKSLPDSYAADMRATWSCTKGAQGWQRARAAATKALAGAIHGVETDLTQITGPLIVYGTDLSDPAAERIEWWPGPGIARGGKSIACSPGIRPQACQILGLDLSRQVSGMPRLTAGGRLVR